MTNQCPEHVSQEKDVSTVYYVDLLVPGFSTFIFLCIHEVLFKGILVLSKSHDVYDTVILTAKFDVIAKQTCFGIKK